MKLAGLFAGIMVKNEFKAEYKHKNKSSGHRVRCWIPSSRETNFEIQFGFLPDNQCNSKFLVAKVHLHGKYIGTFIGDECSLTPVSIISGMQGENGVVPLRFIQQRPADNVRKADDTSELDTIKIIIEQKRWFKHRDTTLGPEEQSDFPKTREDTAKALYSEDTGGRAVLRIDRDCSQLSKPGYYLGNAGPKPKEFVFHSASQSECVSF
ncbi:hypothetical protein BDV93DRAFT_329893 [Ceratobasidium sp. AG-I]|nr:hypothetical protein BDV93DRAFT_329893 [Ceratobasidium sp. AG-I]